MKTNSFRAGWLTCWLAIFFLLILTGYAFATDVSGTVSKAPFESNQVGYSWDISGVITVAGDSNVMVGSLDCAEYTLFIKASGTVAITAIVKVSFDNTNWSTTNTYSLTAAGVTSYSWTSPTPYMKLTYDPITTGQIDDTRVYCRTK